VPHQLIKDELADSPRIPGQLALRLHAARSADLQIALPDDWGGAQEEIREGYVISAGQLTFNSLADRNQALAEHLIARHFSEEVAERDVLFSLAHWLWVKEIGRTDFASGRLLAEGSKHSDILHLAAEHIADGARCFDVLHVIDAMLIHAQDCQIESIVELAHAQHEATKGDLMGGLLYSALDRWLTPRQQPARALYTTLANATDEVAANLLGTAIVGLSHSCPSEAVALLIETLESELAPRRRIGISIAGRLLQQSNISAPNRTKLEQVIFKGFDDPDGGIRREAVRAAASAIHLADTFDNALIEAAKTEDQDTLAEIENALFMKSSELQEQSRFLIWLPLLHAVAPSSRRTIDDLDYVLSTVLESDAEHRSEVVGFLTEWTLRHSGSSPVEETFAQSFHQCLYKLAEQPDILASIITEWLSHEARQLAAAAAGMLAEFAVSRFHAVHFDPEKLGSMDTDELLFLARRMLGFVHDPQQLLSLSLSMLNVNEDALRKTMPLLRTLIVDEIGYDYPGTTMEALTTAATLDARADVQHALEEWRQFIESEQKVLDELPRLDELRPPSQLQRQFALARGKQMERARENASQKSIVRQLATEIPLKAGRGCFNHVHGEYSEPSQLSSFSYSMELPRREILDPVGNAIRGFNLRTTKKNTE